VRFFRFSALFPAFLLLAILLIGCAGEPQAPSERQALRPPVYGSDFRDVWNDNSSEVCAYNTERMRQGKLQKGSATAITRRLLYSEDERVPIDPKVHEQARDAFPAIEMNWIERTSSSPEAAEEMTTSAVTLTAIDGRVPGVETKTDFSLQGWDGQLFHQLLFDASGVRSHQYSYFANEGDEQITLGYPRDGVSGDALWFWARHMAAPLLNSGEKRAVSVLPALRDVREEHRQLNWQHAVLSRSAAQQSVASHTAEPCTVTLDDGHTETFYVETARPFRVLRWTDSTGESADLVSTNRTMRTAPAGPTKATP
jgi:hypothetical protein